MATRNVPFWSQVLGDGVLTAALLNQILGGTAGGTISSTSITTVGAGTLTAAALLGGQIARTGPVAAFTDTTDTAANIVSALGGFQSGQTFQVAIKNATAFAETLAGGTGVTMSAAAIVPPLSIGIYFATVGGTAASPTVTFTHRWTTAITNSLFGTNPQATALSTVGAGVVLAAAFNTGVLTRSGVQSAVFTDTTDTAVAIIAGIPSFTIVGASIFWTYVNNTIFPATLHAGAGVTLTDAVIPANSWARFLVSYSSAGVVTIVNVGQGYFPISGTVTANGATPVSVSNTAVTANSQIVLTYKSGTPGATGAFVSASTPGTSFSIKSVAGDSAVYNYTILG